VDEYPLPPRTPRVEIRQSDIRRALGVEIPLEQAKELLERLEFKCDIRDSDAQNPHGEPANTAVLVVSPPPIRMDIGDGLIGLADVMEEIARLYGYDNIPETRLADPLPPQRGNPSLEAENRVRDTLARLGLREVISYRLTAPEAEARLLPNPQSANLEYIYLANPIAPEKRALRRSLLASVLGILEKNARQRDSLALFEVGSVYVPQPGSLPAEPRRLAIAISGKRYAPAWDVKVGVKLDFYDLKGIIEALMDALRLNVSYAPAEHPSFHPGKCAAVLLNSSAPGETPLSLGVFGELHPQVSEHFDFTAPVLAADFDLEAILTALPGGYPIQPVSEYPPVLEDIALIVDESLPADRVESLIRQTGGKLLESVHLFDVFRGEQVGSGKKSLAYALVYRSPEGTLTDKDAAAIRSRIVKRLEKELDAKLRG